jgi:hypothetical protein
MPPIRLVEWRVRESRSAQRIDHSLTASKSQPPHGSTQPRRAGNFDRGGGNSGEEAFRKMCASVPCPQSIHGMQWWFATTESLCTTTYRLDVSLINSCPPPAAAALLMTTLLLCHRCNRPRSRPGNRLVNHFCYHRSSPLESPIDLHLPNRPYISPS